MNACDPVLDRLLGAIEDGTLPDLPLAPDGRYQTRTVTLRQLTEEVADHLARTLASRDPEDLPVLVCSWGKCRVGSTALTNLFGIAGLPAYYQPVKTTARHLLLGSDPPEWHPPSAAAEPYIYSKEMAGPYLPVETVFNPLEMLERGGYPARKLQLLVLERDPYASLASWILKWSDRLPRPVVVAHFALSSLQVPRMEAHARGRGIPVTHFAYEASRRPHETIAALLGRLGVGERFSRGVVEDWDERGALSSERSAVVFPREPDVYVVPGLHASEKRYAFRPRDTSILTGEERALVERLGLPELYRASVAASVAELGLSGEVAQAVFGDGLAAA